MKWIETKEQMPGHNANVLVCVKTDKGYSTHIGIQVNEDGFRLSDGDGWYTDKVEYWAELPYPPHICDKCYGEGYVYRDSITNVKRICRCKMKKEDFFICGRCNQEWEPTFMCESCSSGEEPVYDAMGYESDNPVCIDTCYNCCNCQTENP